MKRYFSVCFILLGAVFIIIGIALDLYWSGIVGWGLAVVCLIFALYYTKYIPNDKKEKESSSQFRR